MTIVTMTKRDLSGFRRMIIDGGYFQMSDEDRKFVDSKGLGSDDMFRILKILVQSVLGLEIVAWHFDNERMETTIWYE